MNEKGKENTYCVEWNAIDGSNSLMSPYENIKGTSLQDALKRRFSVPLRRARLNENGDVAIRKGAYEPERNRITCWGDGKLYWYVRRKEDE